jgi:hypothetical protein
MSQTTTAALVSAVVDFNAGLEPQDEAFNPNPDTTLLELVAKTATEHDGTYVALNDRATANKEPGKYQYTFPSNDKALAFRKSVFAAVRGHLGIGPTVFPIEFNLSIGLHRTALPIDIRNKFVELGMQVTVESISAVLDKVEELTSNPDELSTESVIELAIKKLLPDDSPIKPVLEKRVVAAFKASIHAFAIAEVQRTVKDGLKMLSLAEMQDAVTKATDGKMALTVTAAGAQ